MSGPDGIAGDRFALSSSGIVKLRWDHREPRGALRLHQQDAFAPARHSKIVREAFNNIWY
jgi:hypothetical protein